MGFRHLPPFGDFFAVRATQVFQTRERFEAEMDKVHEATLRSWPEAMSPEERALGQTECFLQANRVHFVCRLDLDNRRVPWCRKNGKPFAADPLATGAGLAVARALGEVCGPCRTAALTAAQQP